MHQYTYETILRYLKALSVDYQNYESLLQCYIYAILNIKVNKETHDKSGVLSFAFEEFCSRYGLSSKPEYIYDAAWFSDLCTELTNNNFDSDYRGFLEAFAPYIVVQWDAYLAAVTYKSFEALVVLYHILKNTRASALPLKSISEQHVRDMYEQNQSVYHQLNITCDAFLRCWEAVYYLPMPKLNVPISKNLVEAVRFYRRYKVSGINLLKNYCIYNQYAKQLEEAFNPWEEFERSIKCNSAIIGISIAESAFNITQKIQKEKPSDVVRATLYPYPELFGQKGGAGIAPQNEGRFECSFLMREVKNRAVLAKQILIVNPSPDFLIAWDKMMVQSTCQCTVAVSSIPVAGAYRAEFKKFKFCLFSDVAGKDKQYDLVAIISTNTAETLDLKPMITACKQNGQILALAPQAMISEADNSIGRILESSGCHVHEIISIATDATVSRPRKKMLLLAQRSPQLSDSFPVYFTQCAPNGDNLIIEKEFVNVLTRQLNSNLTLDKMRRMAIEEKQKDRSIERRNSALTYTFSDEIKLRFTIHRDKHNAFVGEAYYRAISRRNGNKKGEKWNSKVTQKGLRSKERQTVIDSIEQVAYYPSVAPCITNDILDYYCEDLKECSLKTIWFCCREHLLRQRSYDDSLAQTTLFKSNSLLSSIHPALAKENDYRSAMQATIPEDSNAIVRYWKQLDIIIRAAVDKGFVQFNPIPALLPEVSKKASKQLQNARNMLSKKTFTFDEESRILAFLNEETTTDFGPRKAKRFEAESIWLLGALHLFTGMSTREACALTWNDFAKITGLHSYQLEVYKFLQDDGSITYQLDEKTSRYNYRKVPVAPLLANMLLSRRTFMQAVLGYSEKQIRFMPIIMAKEYNDPHKLPEKLFCKFSRATAICRQLIQKADIPTQKLILPGSNEEIIVDMNKYQGDIFYSNFKHRANHTCAFQRGELSYMLGNKAPDTFSQHYCDYSSDLSQYSMAQKLQRWTYLHEYPFAKAQDIATETSHVTRKNQIEADFARNHHNAVDIMLVIKENTAGSYIDIEVDCDHGVAGSITVYPYKKKGDIIRD